MTPRLLVIPAAGFGTRMRAIAGTRPKELLPLAGHPAILYALEDALDAGIVEAAIILRRGKTILRDVLTDPDLAQRFFPLAVARLEELRRRLSLHFLFQTEPRGEADAIGYARSLAGSRELAVVYPDNVRQPHPGALRILMAASGRMACPDICALTRVTTDLASAYANSGRVDLLPEDGTIQRVRRFLPKGDGPFTLRFPGELRTCGIWLAGNHLFHFIDLARQLYPHGELTDGKVRRLMAAHGYAFYAAPLPGVVYDIGLPVGYRLAQRVF